MRRNSNPCRCADRVVEGLRQPGCRTGTRLVTSEASWFVAGASDVEISPGGGVNYRPALGEEGHHGRHRSRRARRHHHLGRVRAQWPALGAALQQCVSRLGGRGGVPEGAMGEVHRPGWPRDHGAGPLARLDLMWNVRGKSLNPSTR
jgi:hypothetical protein